ncbi:hypothetical protein [Salinicola avicenniae]|uniref:hypothetical protein n=1 Tax=Salinicola avicenniae TaxID=2916836 RepID=UPI0020736286|nr:MULTISPECIES: hypothetical protein [unclassified Salinicola]
MSIFLLVFAVCLLISLATVAALMLSRTPRYRTGSEDLLQLFDAVLDNRASEARWHAVIGHPIRHDAYLENLRQRSQRLMESYGRPWQAAQGGSLLSRSGREELAALRDHLAAHQALHQGEYHA